jgi:sulfite reductase beta subunit-like hemoprotein
VASIAGARLRSMREPGSADGCPGVLRLHAAADGYLARVRLPGGRVDAHGLEVLAQAASLGSDIVELTSRAGLQVRGLAEDSGEELAQLLSDGGLLPSLTHERVRNIVAAPLAGRDPASLAPLDDVVQELDRELCADPALAELPGRFLFALDDGTKVLDGMRADVQLTAEGASEGYVFRLWLDGRATSLTVSAGQAPGAALDAARGFLELRNENAEGAWRVREIEGGAERLASHLRLALVERSAVEPRAPSSSNRALAPAFEHGRGLGLRIQRDGLFAVAVLPTLARLDRAQLERLSQLARALDSGAGRDASVRISPWRTLTFVDVPVSVVEQLVDELEAMGLIASDASGWSGLSACAGMGACARALADVRAAAAERALVRKPSSPSEHWSGCERRCGESADAGVRVVAIEHGLAVSRSGSEQHVASTAAALELLDRESVPA